MPGTTTTTITPSITNSIFAAPANVTVSTVSQLPINTNTSPFGSFTNNNNSNVKLQTGANLFNVDVPKSLEQSIFAQQTTVASTTTPFGVSQILSNSSNCIDTSTSIFNSSNTSTMQQQQPQTSNLFSGIGNTPNNTSGSIFGQQKTEAMSTFGDNSNTITPPANTFGQINQITHSAGGSIFGATPSFGSPSQNTSIFGGIGGSTQTNSANGVFGNAFGNTTDQSVGASQSFGSSPFGGGAVAAQQQNVFGSPANSFGGGGSLFGTSNTFGSGSNASSQSMFGSQPSFGGAATFGSPKGGFGTFANATQPNTFSQPPTQNNPLFETLGSSDSGMTFGNLAHTTNAQNQKPSTFGG